MTVHSSKFTQTKLGYDHSSPYNDTIFHLCLIVITLGFLKWILQNEKTKQVDETQQP
jgi:hypothetical protein